MAAEWYELFSLLMRYVFVLLGLLIVFRVFRWIRRDAKQYNRDMRRLPDAGLVGEMVDLESGKAYPLPREGMIGSARGCDICVRRRDVAGRHATFIFEEGKGLRVTPYHGRRVTMDGETLRCAAHALHGSIIGFGPCDMRVRLFAGLNVPHPSAFARDDGFEREGAPGYQTPLPYPATSQDGAAYIAPPPLYPPSGAREDMQNTWSYAVPPPETRDTPPYGYGGEVAGYAPTRDVPDADETGAGRSAFDRVPPSDEQDDETPAYQSPMPARRRRRDRR